MPPEQILSPPSGDTIGPPLRHWRNSSARASRGMSGEPIYRMFVRALDKLAISGESALDYGCGTATLARMLLQKGRFKQVCAVDIIDPPPGLEPDIRWIQADLNDGLVDLPGESFDLVLAAEVIEHLENPRAVAREWFRLLRPGGYILFSTPNNESWRSLLALLLQGHFVQFGDSCYPAHISALLRKDMHRILVESGFDKPQFMFSGRGGIPRVPGVHWQHLFGGLLRGVRFSDNVLVIARKPPRRSDEAGSIPGHHP